MIKQQNQRVWGARLSSILSRTVRVAVVGLLLAANALAILPARTAAAIALPATQQFTQPCGNSGTPTATHHVIWIWMENEAYTKVIGSTNAPYQNSLASQCGLPTNMYNTSHGSLINYVAATNGQSLADNNVFVAHNDCVPGSVCNSTYPSIFSQTEAAGETWRGYNEDMPTNCTKTNTGEYVARHNPAVYYPALTSCAQFDIAMGDATTQTGAFYDDVRSGTLPNFSFIAPNLIDDAHDSSTAVGDTWLSSIIPTITNGANYQSGDTTIFITNDEGGAGTSDHVIGEDCANQALAASQPSCHIPTIVVSPYTVAGTQDATFYTHYSMLRTTEELLGLPLLGLAASANSMTAAFNLGTGSVQPPTLQPVTNLRAVASSTSQVNLTWTASALATGYNIFRDGGSVPINTTTGTSYGDMGLTASTTYNYSVVAFDAANNTATATAPPVTTLSGAPQEFVANQSVEADMTGWTGIYNSTSSVTRVQVAGGSYDGAWALKIAPKSGSSGTAGVNNVAPIWIPGAPGASTVAGQTYTGSAYVKASVAGEQIKLYIRETTPGGTTVSSHTTPMTLADTNWHQIVSPYTAQGSGNLIRYSLYGSNFASSSQYVYADQFSLTTLTTTPPPADTTPPPAPIGLTATPANESQINLSWTAPIDNVGVTGYNILRGDGVQIGTTSGTTYSINGLLPSTTYSYSVAAFDAANNTSLPATASATTLPTPLPPTAPTNLTATPSPTTIQVVLNWGASTSQGTITGYQVTRDGVALGTATTTSYTDTAVVANTTYTYTVTATDSYGGVSPSSNSATAKTLALPSFRQWIANTGVETNTTGWGGTYGPSPYVSVTRDATVAHSGTASIKVTGLTGANNLSSGFNDNPRWVTSTVAGTVYSQSAWVDPTFVGQKITLRLREWNGSTLVTDKFVTLTAATTGWQQMNQTLTAGGSGNQLSFAVYAIGISAGQYFYADDFSLTTPN